MNEETQLEWGDVTETTAPTTARTHEQEMEILRFDKKFQTNILGIFLFFIATLLLYDYMVLNFASTGFQSRFSEILMIAVPVFTFLLGMGTQSMHRK